MMALAMRVFPKDAILWTKNFKVGIFPVPTVTDAEILPSVVKDLPSNYRYSR